MSGDPLVESAKPAAEPQAASLVPEPSPAPVFESPTPAPEPTPTEPVFRGARTGNDLGYLTQEPVQAPNATPLSVGDIAAVLDNNPNFNPNLGGTSTPEPTLPPTPTSTETPPPPILTYHESWPGQPASDEPLYPHSSEPQIPPNPAAQPLTEGYHLGDTVVITPEMRAEIDRIKTEGSSNQPTEPISATTPPIAPVAPTPAVNQPPYIDAMGNSISPAELGELDGTQPFSTFPNAQQPTQPSTETLVTTKRPGFLSRLFGGGR